MDIMLLVRFENVTPHAYTVRYTPTPLDSGADTAYTSGTYQLSHWFSVVFVLLDLVFCVSVYVFVHTFSPLPNVLSVLRLTSLYYPFRIFNMIPIDCMNKSHLFL
jgi:hypothetical protein